MVQALVRLHLTILPRGCGIDESGRVATASDHHTSAVEKALNVEARHPDALHDEYLYGRPLYPAAPLAWLAPFLSFACGVAASGAWTWAGASLLRLLLGLLLAGPLLGMAWAASTGTEWRHGAEDSAPGTMPPRSLVALPYTLPGSVSHRLSSWLSELAGWWQQVRPRLGNPLLRVVAGTIFCLTVAIQQSPQSLVVAAVALVIAYASGFGRRWWMSSPIILHSAPIFLTWLLGHAAYADLQPVSVAVAASFALAFCRCAGGSRVNAELVWQVAPQLAAAVCLVPIKQPAVAAAISVLVTLPLLLAPLLGTHSRRGEYFRIVQTQLAASMVLAALAVGYSA